MAEGNSKVMLAVDGSDESLAVVRYVSEMLSPSSEILLFHVMNKVPEVLWDLAKDPEWLEKIEGVKAFEKKQEDFITAFTDQCIDIFQQAGFASGSVSRRIGIQKQGIARDIVAEAKRGYDALVVGRGKTASLSGMPLGSVASKILSAVPAPAVLLVGARARAGKVLIAMDSSENSIQAVKQAGKMLDRSNTITLFHAIREVSTSMAGLEEIFPESYRQRLLDDAGREIQPTIKLAKLFLNKMDIAPERIQTKIVTGVKSRAAAIFEEAVKGGYGTVVVGRRGVSEVMDFSMGRVTNKLTQLVRDQALWIVS